MATIRETEFLFRARDEVSRVLGNIDAGIAQTAGTARAAGEAMGRAGRQTSEFTRFIRQQRQENRLQSFVFRESTQVIQAGALALTAFSAGIDGSNRSMRILSTSLNQGFLAFQGFNFLLARANPTVAITTSVIAGLGAAILSFTRDAEGGKEAAQKLADATQEYMTRIRGANEAQLALELQSQRTTLALLNQRKAALELQLSQAPTPAPPGQFGAVTLEAQSAGKANLGLAQRILDLDSQILEVRSKINALLDKQPSRYERINEEAKKRAEAEKRAQQDTLDALDAERERIEALNAEFTSLFERVFPAQSKLNQQIADRIELYQRLGGSASYEAIKREGELTKVPEPPKPLQPVPEISPEFFSGVDDVQLRIINNFKSMGTVAEQTGDLITGTMQSAADLMAQAFLGAFDRIEDAFKALIRTMLAEMIKLGILQLIKTILSVPLPAPGPPTGRPPTGALLSATAARPVREEGLTPSARPRATRESTREARPAPESVTNVTIYVTPEARTITVADQRRVLQVIGRAIFTEK